MYPKLIFKLIVSLTFITFVVFKVDMKLIWEALISIQLKYYFMAFLLLVLNSIILAQKFKIVMQPSGIYQPLIKLIRINFLCRFYSMFLTSTIGQSVIRWHISTKNQEGRYRFIAVMVFERSSFLLVLFVTAGISLMLAHNDDVLSVTYQIFPFLFVGILAIALYYFSLSHASFYQSINRFFFNLFDKRKPDYKKRIAQFFEIFGIYAHKRKLIFSGLCLACIWQLLFLLRIYLLVISIDASLSFAQVGWMASLVLLLQILPISLNGIGLRETAYALLFRLQNLPPEQGVVLGFIIFSQMLLISIFGGVLYLISKE